MKSVNDQQQFHTLIDYERSLSDRNNKHFSVIAFHINGRNKDKTAAALRAACSGRLRETDEIGWLDDHYFGAVLPGTGYENARKPAYDILRLCGLDKLRFDYSIFSYPAAWKEEGSCGEYINSVYGFAAGSMPVWKRAMDLVLAVSILLCIVPFMVLIALYIKSVSAGPVFFKQQRVGYRGRMFDCWKFRTMHAKADESQHKYYLIELINQDKPMLKLDYMDSRILPLGKLMRRAGIDELPQLLNVIRGEMSLIGPRPCIPYEAAKFSPWHLKRFETLPGMTGLWQVSGKNSTTFREMMRLDISYIQRRTVWMDFKILARTPRAILEQVLGRKKSLKEREFKSL